MKRARIGVICFEQFFILFSDSKIMEIMVKYSRIEYSSKERGV